MPKVLLVLAALLVPTCQNGSPADGLSPIPRTAEEWEAHAQALREGIARRLGFDPTLPRPPVEAVIHGRQEFPVHGYSVENVYFESFPGVYVTGNLWRPLGDSASPGPRPAILHPHGHFGPRYEYARNRASMLCALGTLARMGAIVFTWDMLGYGDNRQLYHPRWDVENHPPSVAAALQTWNSLRALDFILARADVDPHRVGVTGPSGGGSQAMVLAAIDPRVLAVAPVVMVTAEDWDACPCESQVKPEGMMQGNVEMAALAAPRPQLVVSIGSDWTDDVPWLEYPFMRQIYRLYGASDLVVNVHFPDEEHDYGLAKRMEVYHFFRELFDLGPLPPIDVSKWPPEPVEFPSQESLHAFNEDHPRPELPVGERALAEVLKRLRETYPPPKPRR